MADIIRLLPDSVANQIAAGEVIQRPASVVKELVENAIDAGGRSITVNIEEGGRGLIQVIDDGCSMSPSDARRCFERHATSKIRKADDLFALSTFGFRGEALASIASVSEVELRTKRAEDEVGLRLCVSGGSFTDPSPVNIPCGTQFLVKNLFYNVPARRKFLKSKSVEMRHIVDEFQRVALCNPQTEMHLYDDDTCRYRLPVSNRRQRIVNLMGKHINQNLLDIRVQTSIITVEGFIGTPQSAKKSGYGEQFLFLNNRYFRSPYFHKAVVSAYEKLIPDSVHPAYFLYFTVDPSRVDVNIHPTKTEIKFEDEQAIWQIINAAVRESLGKLGAVPLMDFDALDPIDIPVMGSAADKELKMPVSSLNPDFNPFAEEAGSAPQPSESGRSGGFLRSMSYNHDGVPEGWEILYKENYDDFDKSSTEGDTFRNFILDAQTGASAALTAEMELDSDGFADYDHEPLATQGELEIESRMESGFEFFTVSDRYAAVKYEGNLLLVDLYRAHRHVLYERFYYGAHEGETANQQELFSEPVRLSAANVRLLQDHGDQLSDAGIDLEFGANNEVTVKGLPADLNDVPAEGVLDSILRGLNDPSVDEREKQKHAKAVLLSRLYGIHRNRKFLHREAENILNELFLCRNQRFTAAGKPIVSVFTGNDIKKQLNK